MSIEPLEEPGGHKPSIERFVPEDHAGQLIEAEHQARYRTSRSRWPDPLRSVHHV